MHAVFSSRPFFIASLIGLVAVPVLMWAVPTMGSVPSLLSGVVFGMSIAGTINGAVQRITERNAARARAGMS